MLCRVLAEVPLATWPRRVTVDRLGASGSRQGPLDGRRRRANTSAVNGVVENRRRASAQSDMHTQSVCMTDCSMTYFRCEKVRSL